MNEKKTKNEWLVYLTVLNWSDGDMKEIYEHEEVQDFMNIFGLKDDSDIAKFLDTNDSLFTLENLKFCQTQLVRY